MSTNKSNNEDLYSYRTGKAEIGSMGRSSYVTLLTCPPGRRFFYISCAAEGRRPAVPQLITSGSGSSAKSRLIRPIRMAVSPSDRIKFWKGAHFRVEVKAVRLGPLLKN